MITTMLSLVCRHLRNIFFCLGVFVLVCLSWCASRWRPSWKRSCPLMQTKTFE